MRKDKNQFANVLATLASMTQINIRSRIQGISIIIGNLQAHYYSLEESVDGEPWYSDIKRLIQYREHPLGASKTDEKTLRRMTMNFYLDGDVMYKRLFDGSLLRCLNEMEAMQSL
jgi:hypothetical protein